MVGLDERLHHGEPKPAAWRTAHGFRCAEIRLEHSWQRVRRDAASGVFHGDHDRIVHPGNAEQVLWQFGAGTKLERVVQHGQVAGGHTYTRTLYADASGQVVLEAWVIHGAGHAWSGGSRSGSYTDPQGPDAAQEMLRFFLEHPQPETA